MATGAAVTTVVATGYQMYAANQAAKEESAAYRIKSLSQREAAQEIMERYEYNTKLLKQEAKKFAGEQTAAVAGAGIAVGSGAHLDLLADTERELNMQVLADRRDAESAVQAALKGADVSDFLANQSIKSGKRQSFGAFLSGASRLDYKAGAKYYGSEKAKGATFKAENN